MAAQRDVVVLGAGIVGICTALHLQQKGWDVAIVEIDQPGRGTSFGNGGLIQREAILPYSFPQELKVILSYALNNRRDSHYHIRDLFSLIPVMFKYWQYGRPEAVVKTAIANLALFEHCLTEHMQLAKEAKSEYLFREDGWVRAFRTESSFEKAIQEHELAKSYGVSGEIINQSGFSKLEPHVACAVAGAIHYKEPLSISDPLGLSLSYAVLFKSRGGRILSGDALTLDTYKAGRWMVKIDEGELKTSNIVVSLGPWSSEVMQKLGYKIPLFVKRGYHMHYNVKGNAVLNHPVYDVDGSYMLTSMSEGMRLVTGAEFCRRDAAFSPVQLGRVEPWAREFFPLGDRKSDKPWMGCRPCLPDMLPVIGPARRHQGLWLAFGHAHHGLTLAAVTGRLLSEMMSEEVPFVNPEPYSVDRFRYQYK